MLLEPSVFYHHHEEPCLSDWFASHHSLCLQEWFVQVNQRVFKRSTPPGSALGFMFWTKRRFSTQPVEQIANWEKNPCWVVSKYLPQLEVKTCSYEECEKLTVAENWTQGSWLELSIRQPPALYTQYTGGTEYLSHTTSQHRKILFNRKQPMLSGFPYSKCFDYLGHYYVNSSVTLMYMYVTGVICISILLL